MKKIRQQIEAVARFPWPVRIEGEAGTGKNLVARALHEISARKGELVRCSLGVVSASEGRENAELFGWSRGAFTGAVGNYQGPFERAHGGTLFLNEVVLASPRVQQLLLDALDDYSIRRMAEQGDRRLDVRVVTATNDRLEAAVKRGDFRNDLFDRLNGELITIPPLESRLEDIPELASSILVEKAHQASIEPPQLHPAEIDRLMSYRWPSNVRELERALEHFIMHRTFPACIPQRGRGRYWRSYVSDALDRAGGNKTKAANAVGVSRRVFHEELKRQQKL